MIFIVIVWNAGLIINTADFSAVRIYELGIRVHITPYTYCMPIRIGYSSRYGFLLKIFSICK